MPFEGSGRAAASTTSPLKDGSRAIGSREPCQVGNQAALSGSAGVPRGRLSGGQILTHACGRCSILDVWPYYVSSCLLTRMGAWLFRVPCFIQKMASADLQRRARSGPHHRRAEKPGRGRAHFARLTVLRLARDGQDDDGEDSRQGRQLSGFTGRRPLQPLRKLPRHRRGQHARRAGNRRGEQQQRGKHP